MDEKLDRWMEGVQIPKECDKLTIKNHQLHWVIFSSKSTPPPSPPQTINPFSYKILKCSHQNGTNNKSMIVATQNFPAKHEQA